MSVLINFKICDNAKECGGIAECPTGAMFWDENSDKIGVDSIKCNCCKACEAACPVGAIRVADTNEEYQKIKFEIDCDPREKKDLFVDRYGATPIDDSFLLSSEQFEAQILSSKGLVLVELFSEDSIQCLLNSIPISEIIDKLGGCITYRKFEADDAFCSKFSISELPAMLVLNEGKVLGKVDAYYNSSQKYEMISEVLKMLKREN